MLSIGEASTLERFGFFPVGEEGTFWKRIPGPGRDRVIPQEKGPGYSPAPIGVVKLPLAAVA